MVEFAGTVPHLRFHGLPAKLLVKKTAEKNFGLAT
jgi:hypothetical protein